MIVFVTGTGTDVGKTVVTAALAATAPGRVAVVKPAQTGVAPGEPGDIAEVTRLSGVGDVHEFARYPDPLSPHHAARLAGTAPLDVRAAAGCIRELDATRDVVIVEGAGGLLVPFDDEGRTMIDLVAEFDDARVVLVTLAGLGTINHTALTLDRLDRAGRGADIVIGRWPAQPGLAERLNVDEFARMRANGRLSGAVPEGAARSAGFAARARDWLAPWLGGAFDVDAFRRAASRPTLTGHLRDDWSPITDQSSDN